MPASCRRGTNHCQRLPPGRRLALIVAWGATLLPMSAIAEFRPRQDNANVDSNHSDNKQNLSVQWPTDKPAAASVRPRLLVLTDIGGDPDDQQSMIRLMLYANEFEIEGLIATSAGTLGELKEAATRADLIREIVTAYGQVRENLTKHSADYPTERQLFDRIKVGNAKRGLGAIGASHDTEGSQWIMQAADRSDPRPLNIAIWGGQTDLAQALWRVREDRGPEGLSRFLARIRVYDIGDQDRIAQWIQENFPDLFYILAKSQPGHDMREGAYRGMYLGGDEALTSREWVDRHLRVGHGPLGKLYPTSTWTAPNPHGTLKEGDTPSWFYFLPTGLNDPSHPEWGGWGGRFRAAEGRLFRDAEDSVGDLSEARATVWRWRPAFQAEFQARMDWCAKSLAEANHRPVAIVERDATRAILVQRVSAGDMCSLDASQSTDPDGDALSFRWWIYREAGTYPGHVPLDGAGGARAAITVPADASGTSIHVILEVTDDGAPPITAFRRCQLQVAPVGATEKSR